ncbi:MAG: rhomboid family intramembrane serine protease [Sciscionella sp.]|nr:rhomboid family intramembrane serine protease [Sciscionella sp.]
MADILAEANDGRRSGRRAGVDVTGQVRSAARSERSAGDPHGAVGELPTKFGGFPETSRSHCQPNLRTLDGVSTQPIVPSPVPSSRPNQVKRVLPPRPKQAAIVIGGFTAVLYLVSLVNATVFHWSLDADGIVPRRVSGLDGILWAPLLHANWQHLFANTVGFVVFGFLAMAAGLGPWIATTVLIWLTSGLGVWLFGGGVTVGASGIIFGWLAYLLVRGVFNRSVGQLGVALVLLCYWGGTLFGLLPGNPGISWQGHLFGALGGVLAAWLTAKANGTIGKRGKNGAKNGKGTGTPALPSLPSTPAA